MRVRALLAQQVEHGLVELALRGGAERQRNGGQRVHLLVLLQDLLVLRAAAVVLLHPARAAPACAQQPVLITLQ